MGLNILDKVYYKLFLGRLQLEKLSTEQQEVTEDNIKKHVIIFILMILTAVYSYFIISNYYVEQIDTVLTSLLGVLFISGTAWFAITFGAIPARFMDFAVEITAHLFGALAIALTAVLITSIIALPFFTPVLFLAFIALYSASVKYDVADGLKIGIDEAVLEHAKVGRTYFVRELERKKK
jgi:hypothetical protein